MTAALMTLREWGQRTELSCIDIDYYTVTRIWWPRLGQWLGFAISSTCRPQFTRGCHTIEDVADYLRGTPDSLCGYPYTDPERRYSRETWPTLDTGELRHPRERGCEWEE